MRSVRLMALLLGALALVPACSGKGHEGRKHAAASPAPPPPTPDTTPIAALRTPAGWLLAKGEPTAAAPTPSPTAAPTPRP
jgi:hypothetical protein